MASVAFTTFLPEVIPHVSGCPEPTALNAIRSAAIEFCDRSLYWQETRAAVSLAAASLPFTLAAPTDARVTKVLSVAVEGKDIPPVDLATLESIYEWSDDTADIPAAYFQISPYKLGLYPIPTGSVSTVLRVAYSPTLAASGIDDFVYTTQLEAIAAGALYRLMAMPSQMWSNPELGLFYRSKFQQAVTAATIEANTSFGRAELQIQMRPFA